MTDRQASILDLVATGLENKEIAFRLGISEQAVKEHVSNLLRLLSAPNRAALADAAATRRFVGTSDLDPAWLSVLFLDAPVRIALLEGPEHRFVAVNDAYRTWAGERELERRTFRDAFSDRSEADLERALDDVFTSGEPRRVARGARTIIVQPMRVADGSVGGVAIFAMDMADSTPISRPET